MSSRITLTGSSARDFVRVAMANLDPIEKALIATLTETLVDPAMAEVRGQLRRGEVALCVDGGEVIWMDTDQIANDLAMKIAAEALPFPTKERS